MGCPCPISRAASEALPTGIRLSRAAAARSLCIAPIEVEGHIVTSAAPTQTKTRHVLMRELPFLTSNLKVRHLPRAYYNARHAMGKRERHRQAAMWVTTTD